MNEGLRYLCFLNSPQSVGLLEVLASQGLAPEFSIHEEMPGITQGTPCTANPILTLKHSQP